MTGRPPEAPPDNGRWSQERLRSAPFAEVLELALQLRARCCMYPEAAKLLYDAAQDARNEILRREALAPAPSPNWTAERPRCEVCENLAHQDGWDGRFAVERDLEQIKTFAASVGVDIPRPLETVMYDRLAARVVVREREAPAPSPNVTKLSAELRAQAQRILAGDGASNGESKTLARFALQIAEAIEAVNAIEAELTALVEAPAPSPERLKEGQ